ncbi:MAG: class I SAM-dependent methyltransferase [Planctomycetota bacterium]
MTLQWLSIRERLDREFRSESLARRFMQLAETTRLIVDLGCGTGANLRYLSDHCKSSVPWRCVDCDEAVLAVAETKHLRSGGEFRKADLATDFKSALPDAPFAVTASAFLDITSKPWIGQLVEALQAAPLLISMTTTGGPIWNPPDDLDQQIEHCLASHRVNDHGFGAAAGTSACQVLADELSMRGRTVEFKPTDWMLDAGERDVIDFFITGVVRRVSSELSGDRLSEWLTIRRDQNSKGELQLIIPHADLLSF